MLGRVTFVQKFLLVVAALVVGAVVVYVDLRLQRGKQADGIPSAVRGVEIRLALAKKPQKAARVKEACANGGCACAVVAATQGLDIDAHLEALGVLSAASETCPPSDATGALHAEAIARLGETERGKSEAYQVIGRDPKNPYGL